MRCSSFLLIALVLGLGIIKLAQAQTLTIEKTWGGTNDDYGTRVAVDASGNIYVTGSTLSFGAGWEDVLVLKYSPAGVLVWQKTWGGTDSEWGEGIAVDVSGNIYVTGPTYSFGAGMDDTFLLKYSSAGALLWQKTWGGTGADRGNGVAVDASGNIYVAGYTGSFGAGVDDVLLLKYSPAGALLWQKTWGGTDSDDAFSVAVDASGNIYVTGRTRSFGAGSWDVLLLKYSPAGALLWQKTWGGTDSDDGQRCAVDASGNIYVTGGTRSFGAGMDDAFLLKYSPAGALLWQKTWGGTDMDYGWSVAVDVSGNICVAGSTASFDAGLDDVLVLKYSSAGALLWQKTWGGTDYDNGNGVAVDASGNICVTGETYDLTRILQGVSGTETAPAGTETTPAGTETAPMGTETMPAGTETTPAGSETYAVAADAILLVFKLPQPPSVGGEWAPIIAVQLPAPYIALGLIALATLAAGSWRLRKKL
jgi:uncharacterized delta-60 repeat protein